MKKTFCEWSDIAKGFTVNSQADEQHWLALMDLAEAGKQIEQLSSDLNYARQDVERWKNADKRRSSEAKGWMEQVSILRAEVASLQARIEAAELAEKPSSVPMGWRLMPLELSREMWAAAGNAIVELQDRGIGHHDQITANVYSALLAAAPSAPAIATNAASTENHNRSSFHD